tara:strand:- start:314 stop:628 length:315 start_codon:yes stop_codon:yes gene_type:complete
MVITSKSSNLKKEIISKNISSSIGLPQVYSAKIINDLIQILIFNLKSGNNIKIKNFGSFLLKKKNQRIGRNPKNKKSYNISKRVVTTFKISENLKVRINKNVQK